MKLGYARISKNDGGQVLDAQLDQLREAGVDDAHIYTDKASGAKEDRPGLEAVLKAAREGDTIVVARLDRLGRSLRHLIDISEDLRGRGIGFKVISGAAAGVDTSTPSGKMMFSMFAAFAEYERELIRERTLDGLKAARARGRKGGPQANYGRGQNPLSAGRNEGSQDQRPTGLPGPRGLKSDALPLCRSGWESAIDGRKRRSII